MGARPWAHGRRTVTEGTTRMEGNGHMDTTGTGTLERVMFHGTIIEATRGGADAHGWMVSLRRCCDSIGLDYSRQLKKLKDKPWPTVGMMPTVGADGKVRDMVMIDRRTLTMWLATINASKVKPELRALLATYQCEAADALDQYFHQGAAIREHPGDSDDDLIARALIAATRRIRERDQRIERQHRQLVEQAPKVEFAERVTASDTTILVGQLAHDLRASGVDIGTNRLFAWLRGHGYLTRRKGVSWNEPTQRALDEGVLTTDTRTVTRPDGTILTVRTPRVTGKGRVTLSHRVSQDLRGNA